MTDTHTAQAGTMPVARGGTVRGLPARGALLTATVRANPAPGRLTSPIIGAGVGAAIGFRPVDGQAIMVEGMAEGGLAVRVVGHSCSCGMPVRPQGQGQ